jgi:hypothetical protein
MFRSLLPAGATAAAVAAPKADRNTFLRNLPLDGVRR